VTWLRFASARYRVIIPYLRGYGTTRFLSSDAPASSPWRNIHRRNNYGVLG
jgi:hypothetical protein